MSRFTHFEQTSNGWTTTEQTRDGWTSTTVHYSSGPSRDFSGVPFADRTFRGDGNLAPPPQLRRAKPKLETNLQVVRITSKFMFAVAITNAAFAGMMLEDLRHDPFDSTCTYHYIKDASQPWEGSWAAGPGRYHNQCRLLYKWTYILLVACAFTMVRALLDAVPVRAPSYWSVQYKPGSWMDRVSTPARVYLLRTSFSAAAAALYLSCLVILASSRIFTGPPPEYDSYRVQYSVCLALICASFAVETYEACTTGLASWRSRRARD